MNNQTLVNGVEPGPLHHAAVSCSSCKKLPISEGTRNFCYYYLLQFVYGWNTAISHFLCCVIHNLVGFCWLKLNLEDGNILFNGSCRWLEQSNRATVKTELDRSQVLEHGASETKRNWYRALHEKVVEGFDQTKGANESNQVKILILEFWSLKI